MERLPHEIFDLPVKIKGKLFDRFVSVLVEVTDERLLPDPSRLDVASGSLTLADACRSSSRKDAHSSDN